ncbi:hypothetical protein OAR00_00810 [Alphaproteobacteria bacterium]|nr:hypothetical protein [Alphaproteobacteria bacterium]MDC1023073.1 hypothetical protein [Alphaproteobacteria bacterium]
MTTTTFQKLEKLAISSKQSRVLFNDRKKDFDGLNVWKVTKSSVIYVDEFYTVNKTYFDGSYRDDETVELRAGKPDFELTINAQS